MEKNEISSFKDEFDEDIFGPDDGGDTEDDKDEPLWDKLIENIINGKVIPVIGADMLIDNSCNLHQYLINGLAKSFRLTSKVDSFSDIVFDKSYLNEYKKDYIYTKVNKIFEKNSFSPSAKLKRLLGIRQFPFVITTSFTPVVEQVMQDIWHDELKVMRFNNDPQNNDDIKDSIDLRKPTVYYMFGKVGEGAHKYVLTDSDMLGFCSSWLSNDSMRPKNLCNELKNKYLLMLGNNFSDWLFRFIWYSMRQPGSGHGMVAYDTDSVDESLIDFLERNETFTKQNPSDVIDQIIKRLNKKIQQKEKTKFNKPEENTDVFISYSRSDYKVAEKLYEELTAQGKRVWFDRYNLTDGGDFKDEIHKAIRTAEYFVPILTDNITREKNERHVYRTEWEWAIDEAISMGRTYIIPVSESNFDFYNAAIPERLQKHNAIFFSKDSDIKDVAAAIIHKMNED